MKSKNNRVIGSRYEELAMKYLIQKDYKILESNYRCRLGEIDIIAKDKEYIVFVEVKYRKSSKYGYPREAVNYLKRRNIINTAKYYLMCNKNYDISCRFDIIEILDDRVNHLYNVFN